MEVSYVLHPEHGPSVTAFARNTGSSRAPFGAGFHPYLSTHGQSLSDTTVQLPGAQRLLVDDAEIPTCRRSPSTRCPASASPAWRSSR